MAISNQPNSQQFIFINTNAIDNSHCIITTNIEGDSIESRIQEAQVVILLRAQGSGADHANGLVLGSYFQGKDCLLIEGNQVPMFLTPGMKNQVRFWEVKPSPELESLFIEWKNAVQEATSLINVFARELLKKHRAHFEIQSDEEGLAEDHNHHKAQLKGCLQKLKALDSKYEEVLRNEFLAESIGLVSEIRKSRQQHKRVWVLLSETHGRYVKAAEKVIQGVSHLYCSLETAGTRYITLKYFDYKLDELAYSHSPEAAGKIDACEKGGTANLHQTLEREIPRFLSIKKQYEEFQRILGDGSWKEKPIKEIGEMMQFFLESAFTWV